MYLSQLPVFFNNGWVNATEMGDKDYFLAPN